MRARSMLLTLAYFICALPIQAAGLTGDWSGHWTDTKSGHTGPLHATFRQCDEDHYQVAFAGRFFKVIPFRYKVVLTVTGRTGDEVFLTGEQNLGPLFGSFTYNATATATDFVAHFCSRRYQGDFILRKCCSVAPHFNDDPAQP
ncbi:MAG TPA: hypothetical protein VNX28_06515 [Gemmataceae bacterium]|nr:hypothetical protein [Gemmataceae bacterium]